MAYILNESKSISLHLLILLIIAFTLFMQLAQDTMKFRKLGNIPSPPPPPRRWTSPGSGSIPERRGFHAPPRAILGRP
ncbi:hypothetical protein QL285_059017 [Trifolium repens]|nr:hypothetical protein QL285_059017 [Trifolium repens]